ncbi:hypothetical protein ACFQ51_52475 [Streptomyces kaempferi]
MTDQPTPITDEMPEEWITELVDHIEADGHDIADAHETAVVIRLTAHSRKVLAADDSDRLFVIGWADDGDIHWGLSIDGAHVPVLHALGGDSPSGIADRAHRVLTTGRRSRGMCGMRCRMRPCPGRVCAQWSIRAGASSRPPSAGSTGGAARCHGVALGGELPATTP